MDKVWIQKVQISKAQPDWALLYIILIGQPHWIPTFEYVLMLVFAACPL